MGLQTLSNDFIFWKTTQKERRRRAGQFVGQVFHLLWSTTTSRTDIETN